MSKSTDDEYIKKIRKSYKSRKLTITILVTTAVIILIPLLYFYGQLQSEINIYIANLNSLDKNVVDAALNESEAKNNYYIGLSIGAVLTAMVFATGSLFGHAISYHFNTRKDGLLIKYYDLSKK